MRSTTTPPIRNLLSHGFKNTSKSAQTLSLFATSCLQSSGALSRHVPRSPKLDSKGKLAASFSHQISIAVPRGVRVTFFFARGTALAAAGRSADIRYENPMLWKPLLFRPHTIFNLRRDWAEETTSFADVGPPTPRTLAILWNGVKFIMGIRVLRAETWGCPSVLDACNQQLRDLRSVEDHSLKLLHAQPYAIAENPYRPTSTWQHYSSRSGQNTSSTSGDSARKSPSNGQREWYSKPGQATSHPPRRGRGKSHPSPSPTAPARRPR
jgi:hypothetical protein